MTTLFLFLLPALGIVLYAGYLWLRERSLFDEHVNFWISPATLVGRWGPLLEEKIPFYRNLSPAGKQKFVGRIRAFINSVSFTPRGDIQITEEMRVMTGACATQLTWGFRQYLIDGFSEFHIFPDVFVNPRTGAEYFGATFNTGTMALSWDEFQKGYAYPDNGRNLGLHEMAHALKLNAYREDSEHIYFKEHFSIWSEMSLMEMERMRNTDDHFLRDYAERNLDEFFAVCVEYFFEQPAEFRKRLPEIYSHLCIMLRLDPENSTGDYALTQARMGEIKTILYDTPLTWFNIKVRKAIDTVEDSTDHYYRLLWIPAILLLFYFSHC